ncbi:MAG: O-antigen ligase family protein [Paraglaciecola polaris]|uniref:O-antigen ligase family protein n=1 Tax=Paraglaciecola polaris TaxID=222814 RepID=UPI00300137E5
MFELVKLIVGLITFFYVVKSMKTSGNKYIAFIVFSLWLRFFLSAFHSVTFPPLIAGFSINALGSIGITAIGVMIIPTAFFGLKKLIPIYVFLATVIISALYNAEYVGLIKVLVKWAYFLTIAIAFFLALKLNGVVDTSKRALVPFIMPVALQLLSVLLGEVKASEADNSASYIGGYNHEAAFSMMLVTFVMLVAILPKKTIAWQTSLFFTGIVFIFLANYRTAVIAVLPVIIIFLLSAMQQKLERRFQLPMMVFGGAILVVILSFFFTTQQERFQDISVFVSNIDELIKAPFYYSELEKDIFSARVYIWSEYLYAFSTGDFWQQLFGNGPDSWIGIFPKYAHNTYVSYLYEFGYLGFVCFISLNIIVLVSAWKMEDKQLSKKVFFSLVGFLIMNLATMPIWAIEGLIVYAILLSLIFADLKSGKEHLQ